MAGGDFNQIVHGSAIVRSAKPSVKRVTMELPGLIATQISASGSVSLYSIPPRPWERSAADRPDQPKPTEDAISPSAPYFLKSCSRTPIDSSPMLSITYLFEDLRSLNS